MEKLIEKLKNLKRYDMNADYHGLVNSSEEKDGEWISSYDLDEILKEYDFVKKDVYYFRDLVKDFPDLMNLNYRENLISDVLHDHGMKLTSDCEICDGDYQDWKGYANCTIETIPKDEDY